MLDYLKIYLKLLFLTFVKIFKKYNLKRVLSYLMIVHIETKY
jgi:hypothetical protein